MAAAPTPPSVGVIAEDDTDVDVVRVLAQRIIGKHVRVRRRVGNGCARIHKKAGVWLEQLAAEGCSRVVLLRDLDRNPANDCLNDPVRLERELQAIPVPGSTLRLICIPTEELEAWFWSDPGTVQKVGRGAGKAHASPHLIAKPKEALIRLSRAANGRPRYSTNDNASLAEVLDLDACSKACPAFQSLRAFLASGGV
jgi:hypothetical protein